MSHEKDNVSRYTLPLRRTLSRSLDSIFNKHIEYIYNDRLGSPFPALNYAQQRESENIKQEIDDDLYARNFKDTLQPRPYTSEPSKRLRKRVEGPIKSKNILDDSEIDAYIERERTYPITIEDFTLLNMNTAGPSGATSNSNGVNLKTALSMIDTFEGDAPLQLEKFLDTCTLAFDLISNADKPNLLRAIIVTKLKGKASNDVRYRTINTFDELKITLSNLFEEKRSLGAVQNEFNNCKQNEGEDVKSFASRLEKLTSELAQLTTKSHNSKEANAALIVSVQEQALTRFTTGLNYRIKTIIRARNYDSLRNAITAAIEEEKELGMTQPRYMNTGRSYRQSSHPARQQPIQCLRCKKPGHFAKNCYVKLNTQNPQSQFNNQPRQSTYNKSFHNNYNPGFKGQNKLLAVTCNYCKKIGHVQKDCRSLKRDNGGYTHNQASRNDNTRSAPRQENNKIESYKINCMSHTNERNIVNVHTKETPNDQLRMLVDTGAGITLLKIAKIDNNVDTTPEVITITGIGKIPVKTMCKITLNIKIGDTYLKHPCYVVPNDMNIITDGLLGMDFLEKYDALIQGSRFIEIKGHKLPLLNDDESRREESNYINKNKNVKSANKIKIEPRTEKIILAKTSTAGKIMEGLITQKLLQPGVYIGNCMTTAKHGRCPVPLLNATTDEITLDVPDVSLETFDSNDKHDLPHDSDTHPTHTVHYVTGKNRMDKLRENIRTDHLNKEEKQSLLEICEKYNDIFYLEGDRLGYTDKVKHKINVKPNTVPVNQKPYRLPIAHKEEINRQIREMTEEGIIQPSASQWNAPLLVVPKKAGTDGKKKYRVVVDFRKLNDVTIGDSYPLPNITDILDQLGGAKYFTTLDLASGFHQISMDPEDSEKTAFSTQYGHFEYKRMPFGLKNAPATFQRLMDNVLTGLQGIKCFVYLDDIVVHGYSLEEHQKRLVEVFDRIRNSGLRLQPNKCKFLQKETIYLGHVITEDGIKPDPSKLEAVRNYPVPKKIKDIQSFLGLAGYYRKFINNFSNITKPLTQLLKKEESFRWTDQEQEAFDILKDKLTSAPLLQYPDFTKNFILTTDASGKAIGAVLSQQHDGKDLPIAYASRTLNKAEINYSTTERELLAIVWATKYFRPYLYGTKFTIVTDHKPLTWLFNVKDPGSRLLKWRLKLEEYEYNIQYKEGKTNQNADALSRMYPLQTRGRGRPRKITNDNIAPSNSIPKRGRGRPRKVQTPITEEDNTDPEEDADVQENEIDEQAEETNSEDNESEEELKEDNNTYTEEIKKQILHEYHDAPLGGHAGYKRTLSRIRMNHNWPGMAKYIKEYISKCIHCQKNKLSRQVKLPMTISDTPEEPFEKCALDIVGPLPETNNRNKYILTFQDLLTKYSKSIPLPDQEANTVAKEFVTKIVCEYGIPQAILTDQGTNFLSDVFKNVCKLLKIKKIQTTAYHPQTNGALERSHRTLAEYLKNYIHEDQTNWDEWLPYAMFTYNSTPHTSTNYTPYELVFGKPPELPTSLTIKPQPAYTYDNYAQELRERIRSTNAMARETLHANKNKSKTYYDKKTKQINFRTGDKVLLHDETVRRGRARKLTPTWIGPYTITEKHDNGNYTIKKGKNILRIHANRIKHFIE